MSPLFMLALVSLAHAEDHATALMHDDGRLGLGLGATAAGIGASGKLTLTDRISLQGTLVGRRSVEDDEVMSGITLGGDVLYRMPILVDLGFGVVAWNLGAGLALGTGRNAELDGTRGYATGISAIAGLELDLRAVPMDVVVEARPSFGLPPDFDWDLFGASAHVRYWF